MVSGNGGLEGHDVNGFLIAKHQMCNILPSVTVSSNNNPKIPNWDLELVYGLMQFFNLKKVPPMKNFCQKEGYFN